MQLILEAGIKSFALLSAAWVAALILRKKSAAVRHLIWSAAFASLLVLPLISKVTPTFRIPVAESLTLPGFVFKADAVGAAPRVGVPGKALAKQAAAEFDWQLILILVWAVGAATGLAKMFVGLLRMERIRSRAGVFAESQRGVALFESEAGSMPMTYGVWRPAILLPADAKEWSEERRRMVLLHEMAHIHRRDGATHLIARLALSLYWWNPLAWVGWREFLMERERAADDLVLCAGERGLDYASELLAIARSMQVEVGWPVMAMASRSHLEGRLVAILDTARDRRPPGIGSVAAVIVAAVGMMVPLAAMQTANDSGADATIAKPLLTQGDEARDASKYDVALDAYNKALATAHGTEAATVLMRMGTVEFAKKNYEAATACFKRAEGADAGEAAIAKMWMAIAQVQQGKLGEAAALYQQSIDAAAPHSSVAIEAENLYSQLLEQQGKQDESFAMKKKADGTRIGQIVLSRGDAPEAYHSGRDVKTPRLTSKVEPGYATEARIAHYQGTVLLAVIIEETGIVDNIQITRGLGFGLDEKAVQAVRQWKFEPGTKDGHPVRVIATIEVTFRLL